VSKGVVFAKRVENKRVRAGLGVLNTLWTNP